MSRSSRRAAHLASSAGWHLARRDFLRSSATALAGVAFARFASAATPVTPRKPFRFGLITDSHYADADPKGTRFYRESLGKVRAAVDRLRAERTDFLAMLGDLKDMATGETEERTLSHLVAVEKEIQRFGGPTFHVLGNHDMDNLSKSQFVAHVTNTGITPSRSFYGFNRGDLHFLVLDATYDKDGRDYDHGKFDWKDANLPSAQLEWLTAELAADPAPAIVFVHQRLDGNGPASIRNREAVRKILEASGKVLAVFQGHEHPGGYTLINGIHYYTLRAVIEGSGEANNAFAVVDISPSLDLTVTGYLRAVSQQLPHRT